MHNLLELLLSWIYPPHCVACRRRGAGLCASCMAACVPLAPPQRLRRLPADSPLERVQGVYAFTSIVRQTIHAFKYQGQRQLGMALAQLLEPHLPWEPAALVPVPLYRARLRERGFNQAALLAQHLGQRWRLPVCDQLQRLRDTGQQVGRSKAERAVNVQAAFTWHGPPPPARVLLIDDVLTTGATLSACAVALRQAGALQVQGLTVARALD